MDEQKYEIAKWLFVMSIGLALESVGLGILALGVIFKASWPRHRRRRRAQIPPMVPVPPEPPVVVSAGPETRLMPKPSTMLAYRDDRNLTKVNIYDDHS